MKTILVTGVTGFVGHHLSKELFDQGHLVVGTDRGAEIPPELEPFVAEYFGDTDLTDAASVAKLPLERLDAVINLAGLAQVGSSFGKDQAKRYNRINVDVHTVLAKKLLELGRKATRVIAVSTGAVYDNHQPMPLNEDSKLAATNSPYALSKVAMEDAMSDYIDEGLDVVVVRPFNHIGPGQLGGFLVPDLISQVTTSNAVVAGDLSTERDYTDVRDVVKAYALLATLPNLPHLLYNICSGRSTKGEDLLELIIRAAGKELSEIEVSVDENRLRPNDPKKVVGNNSLLRSDTGWAPTISLQQTISDILVYNG
jgi:GDP-4-dehydro-6-deoxy-D-mannose reductase